MKINLFDISIDSLSYEEAAEMIGQLLDSGEKQGYIFTPNVDHIVLLQRDREFRRAYEKASLVLPDGMPLIWASRLLGRPLKGRVNGTDIFCGIANIEGEMPPKIFILGGRCNNEEKEREVIVYKFPKLHLSKIYAPPFGFENDRAETDRIIKMINETPTDILVLTLGSPKSEKWILSNINKLNVKVAISVGATIDFITGRRRRAPIWMQKIGLEWFYRLVQEPRRLWKRYLVRDMLFFWILAKEFYKIKIRKK